MTIVRVPLKTTYGLGEISVTITNPKNKKSIKTDLEIDTGAFYTAIPNKTSRNLGLDLESGTKYDIGAGETFYLHLLQLKVGNLRPVSTMVEIPDAKTNIPFNVMGLNTLQQFKRVEFSTKEILFEDNPAIVITPPLKTSSYVNLYPSWYSYKKRI